MRSLPVGGLSALYNRQSLASHCHCIRHREASTRSEHGARSGPRRDWRAVWLGQAVVYLRRPFRALVSLPVKLLELE